jgi:hypothetical protein
MRSVRSALAESTGTAGNAERLSNRARVTARRWKARALRAERRLRRRERGGR